MRNLRLMLFVALFGAVMPGAQGQSMPGMDEMQRQMLDMQQRLMQELRNSPLTNGSLFSDTTFFFRLDTTFENGSAQFFQFGTPGGSDDMFDEFDRMFNDLFQGFGDMPYFGEPRQPADDGGMRKSEEELLPEEKLRQENTPEKKPAESKSQAKKQSIRI
ncbi:MAG: hypothetical protein IT270_18840 [Saprospiraceae bacterium]|nr:hypothetical protein [Saprospiraceae bacterium]